MFRTLGTPADIWAACTVTLSALERTNLDSIVNDNYRILEVKLAAERLLMLLMLIC
jgi:hypothetical protein